MFSHYDEVLKNHRDRVPEKFDHWVRAFGIEEAIGPICYTVVTWVKHCSSPVATPEQLALAAMDLAISFFYLDDYQQEDYQELFAEFRANLDGEPSGSQRPTTLAHADLIRQIAALGRPMEHFLAIRKRLLDEYEFRNAVMRMKADATFDRYMSCRLVTIDVYQWFELWVVLDAIELTPQLRKTPDLQDAIRLAATFFFLGNDLYSVRRDEAKGEPNLVLLFRDEQNLSLEAAATEISRRKDAALQGFVEATDRLLAAEPESELFRCGVLLRKFVDNATISRHENPERYLKPDDLVSSGGGAP